MSQEELFNPQDFADEWSEEKQKDDNTYVAPPSGKNIVVNIAMQHSLFSSKNPKKDGSYEHYKKLIIWAKVAKHLKTKSAADKALGPKGVGRLIKLEMWFDLSKKENKINLSRMCNACGNVEPFDPRDDKALAAAILGHPYGLTHEMEVETWNRNGQEKSRNKFFLKACGPLRGEKLEALRKEIIDSPDFDEDYAVEVKDVDDRRKGMGSDGGGGGGGGNARGGGENADYDFYDQDDDLPF